MEARLEYHWKTLRLEESVKWRVENTGVCERWDIMDRVILTVRRRVRRFRRLRMERGFDEVFYHRETGV